MNDLHIYYENQKKSTIVAFLLWLFFGSLGIHRFYLERIWTGIVICLLSFSSILGIWHHWIIFITSPIVGIWLFIDLFLLRSMTAYENSRIYNDIVRSNQVSTVPTYNIKESEQNNITCKYCNSIIPSNSSFCINCGNKIDYIFCKYCGSKVINSLNYCTNCGQKIN